MNEGKKDRRDPIRTIKTKNPVAKAHQTVGSGSGAHKDKKKAMKQGEVKHKKQEYAEGLQEKLNSALIANNSMKEDDVDDFLKAGGKITYGKPQKGPRRPGLSLASKHIGGGGDKMKPSRTGRGANTQGKPVVTVEDDFDSDEYNDEAGMSHNSLRTIHRAAVGLLDQIQDGDNLPEWCQEKISIAEDYLVTVWDYLQSEEKEAFDIGMGQASYGKGGIGEGKSALEKFRSAAAEREKKHADIETKRQAAAKQGKTDVKGAIDRLEKHVNAKEGLRDPKDNPCWKGYKPVGTKKKGGKTVPNCVPKEGWTHDTLAAQLFETENTYEDRLTNLLNKRLGK